MNLKIHGIHHVSTIAQHPQENVEFYTGFLGLRMVKNTLNYDDVSMYHFYYGNHDATQNVSTFFPMPSADEGKVGTGQVGYQTYAVPVGSLPFWEKRLQDFKIPYFMMNRYGLRYLVFKDPHGFELEMVEKPAYHDLNQWEFNGVKPEVAIQGIDSVALYSSHKQATLDLLVDLFGYQQVASDQGMIRLRVSDDLGGEIELRESQAPIGTRGYGTVHHVALKVDDGSLDGWYELLVEKGYTPTHIRKRHYFQSIYFRDKGGILFELATLGPGMMVDEPFETLGEAFIVPEHFKEKTDEILAQLAPIEVREIDQLHTYSYRDRQEYEFLKKRQDVVDQIAAIKRKDVLTDKDEASLKALRETFKTLRETLK